MKTGQKPLLKKAVASVMGVIVSSAIAASLNAATPLTVDNITDWNATPMEAISCDIPFLNFNGGGIQAGINVFQISDSSTTYNANGFCIDPFHWSANGPASPYYIVPLVDAPKSPAQLNSYTATEIEDLWAEFYSPNMSSPSAAGLQIAIWELVSSNAIASDGLPANMGFTLTSGDDYGAGADLASLSTYAGAPANLIALTGPGQDFVTAAVPDTAQTLSLLILAVAALIIFRPVLFNKRMTPNARLFRVDSR